MAEVKQHWIIHPFDEEPQLRALHGQGGHHGADSDGRFISGTDVNLAVVPVNLPVHGFQAVAKDL